MKKAIFGVLIVLFFLFYLSNPVFAEEAGSEGNTGNAENAGNTENEGNEENAGSAGMSGGSVPVEPVEIKELSMTLSLPEGELVITRDSSEDEVAMTNLGLSRDDVVRDMEERNSYLIAFSKSNPYYLEVVELETGNVDFLAFDDDTLKEIWINDIRSLERQNCRVKEAWAKEYFHIEIDPLPQLAGTADKREEDPWIRDTGTSRFLRISYTDSNGYDCLMYYTVHSEKGIALVWRRYDDGTFSDEEKAVFKSAVDSVSYHTPPNRIDITLLFNLLLMIAVLPVLLLLIMRYVKEMRSRSARQKAEEGPAGDSPECAVPRKAGIFDRHWTRVVFCLLLFYLLSFRAETIELMTGYYDRRWGNASFYSWSRFVIAFVILADFLLAAVLVVLFIVNSSAKKKEIRGVQHRVRKGAAASAAVDPRDSILYLRPFKTDANDVVSKRENGKKVYKSNPIKKYRNSFGTILYRGERHTNFESILCKALNDEGIPVAIGDPGEKIRNVIPETGASRIYTDDETWKEVVESYFVNAKAVVLYVDFTRGVIWEIDQAVNKYSDKVIFVPKLYNKHLSRRKLVLFCVLAPLLFIPFYYFGVIRLVFPTLRRGRKYYKEWADTFGFSINDKVCAVTYQDGKPVLHYTKNGKIDRQLGGIVNTLRGKTDSVYIDDKVLVRFPAAVSRKDDLRYIEKQIPNCTLGFTSNGIRFNHSFVSLILEMLTIPRMATRYMINRKIAYSDIYSVVPDQEQSVIKLVTETINEEYYLCFPSLNRHFDEIADFFKSCKSAESGGEEIQSTETWASLLETEKSADREISVSALVCSVVGALFYLFMFPGRFMGAAFMGIGAILALQSKKKWLALLIFAAIGILIAMDFSYVKLVAVSVLENL